MSARDDDFERARTLLASRGGELGRELHWLRETTSTNDEAKRAAKLGAAHGTTWVADAQTAGRGRQGRGWLSAAGENLLFSVLLRVTCPPARLPPLALVAGLAARDAIAAAAPSALVRIKWPNDVVVGEARAKIAGVLVEATLSGAKVEALIVGIGINVHTRDFPDAIADRATSVARLGGAADRAAILADVLAGLERDVPLVAARGLASVLPRLTASDALRGEPVGSEAGEGTAEGIDADGRLVVRGEDGIVARWGAGEVHLRRRT